MASTRDHYEQLLGSIYRWSTSGAGDPFERGAAFLARHGLDRFTRYLDLGAGFGAHAVPLARAGKAVTAIDFHPGLLADLRAAAPGVETHCADLIAFLAAACGPAAGPDVPAGRAGSGASAGPAGSGASAGRAGSGASAGPAGSGASAGPARSWDAVLCLGDTLTHLPDPAAVQALLRGAARVLTPGGILALAYRDYTGPARHGVDRFIPVRADAHQSLLCCLDVLDADHLAVTDILTLADPAGLRTQLSTYVKLRLAPATITAWATSAGLTPTLAATEHGMQLQVFRAA